MKYVAIINSDDELSEDAIKAIKDIVFVGDEQAPYCFDIESIKQASCEDCVSRQYIIEKLNRVNGTAETDKLFEIVENAPPVTPTRKKGKWIKVKNGRGGHECNVCQMYAPSYQSGDEYLSKFCPNCGAEMESEKHDTSREESQS